MIMLLAFVAFAALVVLWMLAPNGTSERAPEGAVSSSALAGADVIA